MIAISEKYTLAVAAPSPIHSERQYKEYLGVLAELSEKDSPTRDEERYAELLLALVEAYEEEHYEIADASPVQVLRALMEANNLRQKDLAPLFGSESIVSEVLGGKRELSKGHIERLSKRFGISPAALF